MPGPVTYSCNGTISRIVMDDGKANVMSVAMLKALHAAFDEAERDKTVAVLSATGRHFSGGFDLNVFAKGAAGRRAARAAYPVIPETGGHCLPRQCLPHGRVPDHGVGLPACRGRRLPHRHE
jgi:enoyl-CoA hydratase/carnithine racemase